MGVLLAGGSCYRHLRVVEGEVVMVRTHLATLSSSWPVAPDDAFSQHYAP